MAAGGGLIRLEQLSQARVCFSLSFLYQTRTILCGRPSLSPVSRQGRGLSSGRLLRSHEAQPFDAERTGGRRRRVTTVDHEDQSDIAPSYNPNSTLTPLEEVKFRRIFEAAAQGLPPPSLQIKDPTSLAEDKEQRLEEKETYIPGLSLDQKFEDHGQGASPAEPETEAKSAAAETRRPVNEPSAASDRRAIRAEQQKATSQLLPEALRGAWRDVQRSLQQNPRHRADTKTRKKAKPQGEIQKQLEKLKIEDTERVKRLFDEAGSDRDIWAILEAQVFSRVSALVHTVKAGASKTSARTTKIASAGQSEAKADQRAGDQVAASSTKKLSPRQVAVIQGTYSIHLINALRCLRLRHPKSPYILTILPTVKQIDPISQVLGSSTAFYNELLYNAWRVRNDIAECARLAEDMYSQGLSADHFTSAVFIDAQRDQSSAQALRGGASSTRRMWWKLQATQSSMRRWHAAMDLLWDRVEDEARIDEEWEDQRAEFEAAAAPGDVEEETLQRLTAHV